MDRLKQFETHADYQQYFDSENYLEPQVSFVVNENQFYYDNITFSDPAVRKAVDNGVFGGTGQNVFSKKSISKITDVWNTFVGNTDIEYFDDFDQFTGLTVLQNGPSNIKGAFYGCSNLKSIKMPKTLKSVGEYNFNGCFKLTELIFPHGLETVKDYSIGGLSAITVDLPSTVTYIGRDNFYIKVDLKKKIPQNIIIRSTTPPTLGKNGNLGLMFSYYDGAYLWNTLAKIYVPYSSDHSILEAYKNAAGFSTVLSGGINILELDENGNIPTT